MEKDKSIIDLIGRLKLLINFTLWEVVDYWEADLCAIGIKKENKLVYISTFNYLEGKEQMYDYNLEIVDEKNEEKFIVIRVGRRISEIELVNEINLFFSQQCI